VDLLAKAMGEKGTIAILAGSQRAPNLQNRVAGAKEALAKCPNIKLNERQGVFYHVEIPERQRPSLKMPGYVRSTSRDSLPAAHLRMT
jgi:ribose transport system substrate-binding protein